MKIIIILCVGLSLTACSGWTGKSDIEMPRNDASGSDLMKKSPCACIDLQYQAPKIQWRS